MTEFTAPPLSVNTIPLHFDVSEHAISLDTFIATAEQTQKIIEAFNQEIFSGTLVFDIIVVPPEPGTFLSKLEFYLLSGATALFAFLNSPLGEGYVKGFTDLTPQEWMQKLGESHKALIQAPENDKEANAKIVSEAVIAEMTKSALSKSNDEFLTIAPLQGQLTATIEARCQFFEACIANKEIKGVEFSKNGHFPIKRRDFPALAIRPPVPEKEEEEDEWFSSIEQIYVTSPNWDREGRKWKGKDAGRKDCLFEIEDDLFWHHVKYRELRVDIYDQLKVQWVFRQKDGKLTDRRVVRVIEYNGEHLNEPMNRDELDEFLKSTTKEIQKTKFDGFL